MASTSATSIRAQAARNTEAASVEWRATTPRATSTTSGARASDARWWRRPSRARRSSIPIRLTAAPLRIRSTFELDPARLGAAAGGHGMQAVDTRLPRVDVQLAVDDERVPAVDGHPAPQ